MFQIARNEQLHSSLFMATARAARACVAGEDLHRVRRTIDLALDPQSVFDCLRNLGCLVDWWPHARALHPIPPGLCTVGDMAVLELRRQRALLRVLVYKPGQRILLVLGLESAPVLIDLSVHATSAGACRVGLQLETPIAANRWSSGRRCVWLSALASRAAQSLGVHLQRSRKPPGF